MIDLLRDDLYRWIGAILIVLGIFFDLIGIMSVTIIPSEEGGSDFGMGMAVVGLCTVIFLIPGIILFVWGYKLGQKEKELEKLAGYLKSYRRIKISDVAKKLGKSEYETEQLIAKIVEDGLIKGYVDRTSGEFFTHQSLFHEVDRPDKCPNCGASMYTRVLSGENAVCDYCGAHFSTKHKLQPPPQTPQPQTPYYTNYPPPPPPKYPPYPQQGAPNLQGKPMMMTVKCPSCTKLFDVQKQAGAFPINCPYCGTKGMMRP